METNEYDESHGNSTNAIRQQTIITIKLRKALLFILLITLLRQQNDLYLHLGRRFQENKTDHTTLDFVLLS